ncbi:MAG TPA: Hint domain-containing protein [Acetobacteraceae bacterium]|nr:Hint domain-containing protein [Acetobacteraceae bacterium]
MATVYWKGNSGNWTDPTQWYGGALPAAGDAASVTAGGVAFSSGTLGGVTLDFGGASYPVFTLSDATLAASFAIFTNSYQVGPLGYLECQGSVANAGTITMPDLGTSSLFRPPNLLTLSVDDLAPASGATQPGIFTNSGTMTIDGGEKLGITGAADGAFVNAGRVVVNGGTFSDGLALSGTGTVEIGAGTVQLGTSPGAFMPVAAAQSVRFLAGSPGGTLSLEDAPDFKATIYGFQAGDVIDLNTNQADGASCANGRVRISFQGTLLESLAISGSYQSASFTLVTTGSGDVLLETSVPCFCAGTLIRTEQGEMPVEALSIGDRLITLSGASRPVRWIGRRSYAQGFARANPDVQPILVAAGALGLGVPGRDLHVSPSHTLFLDGVLVAAADLVNGVSIRRNLPTGPIRYVHVELDAHDVIFAEGAPAESYMDRDSRWLFQNADEFIAPDVQGATETLPPCAPIAKAGPQLDRIRLSLAARAAAPGVFKPASALADNMQAGPMQGHLDRVEWHAIAGWVVQTDHPDTPVVIDISDGDVSIARLVADQPRPDVAEAGIGNGRCGFDLRIAPLLSPFRNHVIHLRRAQDGAELPCSPMLVPAVAAFDPAARLRFDAALRAAAACTGSVQALDEMVHFLAGQTDQLLQERANLAGGVDHPAAGMLRQRWADRTLPPPADRHSALVIDHACPRPDRDAGSVALLGHVRALQRLGFRVGFVAADEPSPDGAGWAELEAIGVSCHVAPCIASVEEALRRLGTGCELIYLHRPAIALRYAALARHHAPAARIVLSVADLPSLRVGRQARIERRTALLAESRALRIQERAAISLVDVVITHSSYEAALLAAESPDTAVHVVPWPVEPRACATPFHRRCGVAFIGGARHRPNLDATRWLVEGIMPLVWACDPTIPCLLAGADLPPALAADPRIRLLGHVPDLGAVFDDVRLTVAPLRFGAGLKGKVLESLAAAVPCVMTPIAAEGMNLPVALAADVAETAAAIAGRICRLHADVQENARSARGGLTMIREQFTPAAVDRRLRAAVCASPGLQKTARITRALIASPRFPVSSRGSGVG